jgi:hypothetical protein
MDMTVEVRDVFMVILEVGGGLIKILKKINLKK